jgi:hypothetical protein
MTTSSTNINYNAPYAQTSERGNWFQLKAGSMSVVKVHGSPQWSWASSFSGPSASPFLPI